MGRSFILVEKIKSERGIPSPLALSPCKGGEIQPRVGRVAAVEKIEVKREPEDFFGNRNRMSQPSWLFRRKKRRTSMTGVRRFHEERYFF